MKSIIEEAKEIIEMSLSDRSGSGEYSGKANAWLARLKEISHPGGAHSHGSGTTCAMCGNDLVCPSCDEG